MLKNYTFSHGLEVLSEEEQIICEGGIGYTPTPMLPIYFMGEFLRGLVSGFKKGYEDAKEFEDNIIYA